jgi:MoxR-like ATPase
VVLGASPRAAIHLLSAAKAQARLEGREQATHEDVVRMAPYVLSHRIIVNNVSARDVVARAVASATRDE